MATASIDQIPQIWPPFPASYPPMGSQGPVPDATTDRERPTPWISDLTGEDIEPEESGSPTIGCRFLKDAVRSPSCDARECARCGAQQAPNKAHERVLGRSGRMASVDPTEARNGPADLQ